MPPFNTTITNVQIPAHREIPLPGLQPSDQWSDNKYIVFVTRGLIIGGTLFLIQLVFRRYKILQSCGNAKSDTIVPNIELTAAITETEVAVAGFENLHVPSTASAEVIEHAATIAEIPFANQGHEYEPNPILQQIPQRRTQTL
ncbi:MAG: hypothetical protein L6R41_005040 [Letrouitia leprolyta]|nr:MAG: hypothetical protein L6R41_005040 [Letrouitia leprolyta]